MNIEQEINTRLLAYTLWSLLEDRLQYGQLHVHQPTAATFCSRSMNDYRSSYLSYLAELIQNHGSLFPGNSNIHYHLEDYTRFAHCHLQSRARLHPSHDDVGASA